MRMMLSTTDIEGVFYHRQLKLLHSFALSLLNKWVFFLKRFPPLHSNTHLGSVGKESMVKCPFLYGLPSLPTAARGPSLELTVIAF